LQALLDDGHTPFDRLDLDHTLLSASISSTKAFSKGSPEKSPGPIAL
jgi:hypothetical protein